MAFNGSGIFQRVRNWTADAAAGIKIRADLHDVQDDDFAAGLTHCITRDGQSIITQNIPWNSYRITGLADPVDAQDVATKAYADTKLDATSDKICPPGALMDFARLTAPPGWLVADGSAVSRTTYAALYTAIGDTWGAGDGTTTFNLPPLSDRFRRNTGTAAGAVGTKQDPANLTHTHTGTTAVESAGHTHRITGNTGAMTANASHSHTSNANVGPGAPDIFGVGSGPWTVPQLGAATINPTNIDHGHSLNLTSAGASVTHTHAFTSAATGDTEARPLSATVLTCIKT